MENLQIAEMKISEIVAENIKSAHVFKKYGIDFCCGGGVTVAKACEKKQIKIDDLLSDLNNIDSRVLPSQNFKNWELDFLIDYIINTHHSYVTETIVLINEYSLKVAQVHGEAFPNAIRIYELFQLVSNELWAHMQKEEQVLFPYIKKLVQAKQLDIAIDRPGFGSIKNPIHMMEQEHVNAGNIFNEIATLSNKYSPPIWACNTFKALYEKLEEFEQDLHIHVHLENNILFPKAISLESNLQ